MFKVYLWDTFEKPGEDTMLIRSEPTLRSAIAYAADSYEIDSRGADRVEIVDDRGSILYSFPITGDRIRSQEQERLV